MTIYDDAGMREEQRKRIVKHYTSTQQPYTEEELKSEGFKSLHNQLAPIAAEMIERAKEILVNERRVE